MKCNQRRGGVDGVNEEDRQEVMGSERQVGKVWKRKMKCDQWGGVVDDACGGKKQCGGRRLRGELVKRKKKK